jgi:hypothetical protein
MSAGLRVGEQPWLRELPAEPMAQRSVVATAAEAEAEIRERGFCVLRGVRWPDGWLEHCRAEFDAVLEEFASRSPPTRGPARYYMNVPAVQPFLQPLSEPRTNAVLGRMLGEGFTVENMASDTPLGLGSVYQDFHQDGVSLEGAEMRRSLGHRAAFHGNELPETLELPQRPDAPWTLIANVGLGAVSALDAPFEIVPCSQELSVEETELRLQAGQLHVEQVFPLSAGDVVIRNPHTVHRGSPAAVGAEPRPSLAYIYTRPSHFATWGLRTHAISERVVCELDPTAQRMLRMLPRGEAAEARTGYNSGEDMARSASENPFQVEVDEEEEEGRRSKL